MEASIVQAEGISMLRARRRTLYWAALAATLLGALYLLGLIGRLVVNGSVHAVSGQGVQLISAGVAIAWDVTLLVLFTALRWQYERERPLAAELAWVFMVLVCGASTVSWFVQLAVMPRLAENDAARLLLDIHNELSISYAMEHLAWGLFFGLSALCAAAAMPATKPGTRLRWLLIGCGLLSLLHLAGVVSASQLLGDLGYVAWGVLLPASTALLAAQFRGTA